MDRIPKHWITAERFVIKGVQAGILKIDKQGRVWRQNKYGKLRRAENQTPLGYMQVRLMIDGKRYHSGAHRLVWQYYYGNIPEGLTINHKNGIKNDNRPENLEILSSSGQTKHAYATGLKEQWGQRNPAAKLTDSSVVKIRLAYAQGGYTMEKLADRFGVSFQAISKIIRGQRRNRQNGPILDKDLRYCNANRDSESGRFAAGRVLDGRTWDEFPGNGRE